MQQQREIEQRGLLQFLQQFGKSPVPFRFRFLQTMQMFNREERMFVHGVAMVEISHHQGFDPFELRQQERQQPQRVHRAESVSRVRLNQRFLQVEPELRTPRRSGGQCWKDLLNLVLGGRAQFQPLLGHEMK